MTDKKLAVLLSQPEGPKLDFKQELTIYHSDRNVCDWARDELIKDILALANGNALVAGQPGHLIFGVADKLQPDGTPQILGVTGKIPTRVEILDIINPACMPHLEDIDVQLHEVEKRQILVITIPPTPHLHETTRELKTKPDKTYSNYVLFTRHNEQVRIASAQEREAIRDAKQRYFKQRRTVKPAPFAAIFGAYILGMQGWSASEKIFETRIVGRILAVLIYGIVGAFTGWVFGLGCDQVLETRHDWYRYSRFKKVLLIVASIIGLGLVLGSCLLR